MSIHLRGAILITVLALLSIPTHGQSANPKYDATTEAKMKATVQELKLPTKENSKAVAHLLVKSGTDTLDIYLCPKSFLDDLGATFAKGDEVVVTGSKVKQDNADVILAREVDKGTDTLVLRDDKGKPVWDWKH